ncbi:hypothetical protein H311_01942 [Anncaliia algerae PRA109]|nr:hypothetical protein H311_01942 [Anncaliia algerae PRA109]
MQRQAKRQYGTRRELLKDYLYEFVFKIVNKIKNFLFFTPNEGKKRIKDSLEATSKGIH